MYKQNILCLLLELLGVKHTKGYTLQYYETHPHKNDLLGLSRMLTYYGIENEGVRLEKDKESIYEIQTPFISKISLKSQASVLREEEMAKMLEKGEYRCCYGIMKKYIFLILFAFFVFYGKSENDVIAIDSSDTTPCFKLSEVAQNVDSVSLKIKKGMGAAQNIFLSEDYIFLQGMSSVTQYTRSGKRLRVLDCEDFTSDIAGDVTKNELYVPAGFNLRCYDMHTGKLKRKLALDSLSVISCVFFENALWMLRGTFQNGTMEYSLSKMDCQSGDIQNLGIFYKESYGNKPFAFMSNGNFSIYQGRLFFALNSGNSLYEIRGNKIVPYLQWQIEPKEHYSPQYEAICDKGKVGRYLFVNYRLMFLENGDEAAHHWFVKDLESDRQFNVHLEWEEGVCVRGTEDDICHSGRFTFHPLYSLPNHFYFSKTTDEGLTFYIVKVKE